MQLIVTPTWSREITLKRFESDLKLRVSSRLRHHVLAHKTTTAWPRVWICQTPEGLYPTPPSLF